MLTAAARQGSDFQPALLKRLQLEREAELVVMLGALLRRYVEGDVDGFQARPWFQSAVVPAIFGLASIRIRSACCGGYCGSRPRVGVLSCWAVAATCPPQTAVPGRSLHSQCRGCSIPASCAPFLSRCAMQESMTVEAAELATASYGDVMLAAIGGVYAAQADIFLGGILDGSLAALRWVGGRAWLAVCVSERGRVNVCAVCVCVGMPGLCC